MRCLVIRLKKLSEEITKEFDYNRENKNEHGKCSSNNQNVQNYLLVAHSKKWESLPR